MLIWFCPVFLKKALTEQAKYPLRGLVSLVLLLMLNTGCSQVPLAVRQLPSLFNNVSGEANFQLGVTPSGSLGTYTVAGTTNLPDQSRITVAAIRYLRPNNLRSPNPTSSPTYSILAYQDVKVNKGKWQTSLNLWKVAPDGQFQEVWQLDQAKLGLSFTPETDVTFLATVAPTGSLSELERQLEKQGIKLASRLVRNTVEGERYIQASQILAIALPTGQTTPPPERPGDVNGGWGPRYLLLPEPPNTNQFEQPNKRRTNIPLSPNELLQ
jgi:hypothetical protein